LARRSREKTPASEGGRYTSWREIWDLADIGRSSAAPLRGEEKPKREPAPLKGKGAAPGGK
jgi:hypothetical protein